MFGTTAPQKNPGFNKTYGTLAEKRQALLLSGDRHRSQITFAKHELVSSRDRKRNRQMRQTVETKTP